MESFYYMKLFVSFYFHHQQIPHKNHAVETFHIRYIAYQTHQCHRCDAPTSPPLIRDFSLCTYFCDVIISLRFSELDTFYQKKS